ncbi:DNA-directed RNA polymerase, mitochondrial isoform X2 [Ixodes scapularis]|uniref:DNA-directed RNA polymerase, mitochondrial isoform X2 n=1 Tax=Ixodes scapularis TaxID=6945 RepID=UPI001A9F303F|nr:DNA-directed RNA polymerase, mitochondrial isoform X2 [Ixodes scapularis]
MYTSALSHYRYACHHLCAIRRPFWTLSVENLLRRVYQNARYATNAEPSHKTKTKKSKVGKLRKKQYRELMKVLEAHRTQLLEVERRRGAVGQRREELILTIPASCNVLALPPACSPHSVRCESCGRPHLHSHSTRSTAEPAWSQVPFPADDLLCLEDGSLAVPFEDLCAHQVEPQLLDAALLEEQGQEEEEEVATAVVAAPAGGRGKRAKKAGLRLTSAQAENAAKVKKAELDKLAREMQLKTSLRAFIEVCVQANLLDQALSSLHFHRNRAKEQNKGIAVVDVKVFNSLLRGFSAKGKLGRVQELLRTMEHDGVRPDAQSYAALLEAHARQPSLARDDVDGVLHQMAGQGITPEDLFKSCKFLGDQRERVLKAIHAVLPDFEPAPPNYPTEYVCPLLERLSQQEKAHETFPGEVVSLASLRNSAGEQLSWEVQGQVEVHSVAARLAQPSERVLFLRKQIEANEAAWRVRLKGAFVQNLKALYSHSYMNRGMSLYPYLSVLAPEVYVNIIIQEMRGLAMSSETFSPALSILHQGLGAKVMTRYVTAVKEHTGIAAKVTLLYEKYLEYYLSPELRERHSAREYWQKLKAEHSAGPSLDSDIALWPYHTLLGVGRFLYDIMIHEAKIDINVLRHSSSTKRMIPAFYNIYRTVGARTKEEIKPHPLLSKLYRGGSQEQLSFDVGLVPMVCPPLPWSCVNSGVFLLTQTPFVRLPEAAQQQKLVLESTPVEQLYPSFDALNILALCPWRINKPVLDLVVEVFLNKGSQELDIPMPPSECPAAPKFQTGMTKLEKAKVSRERMVLKRKRAEMYSLWCDALYKLSIANHFKDRVFWFPHNMDFRGRVYPCPPHFNHLGSDVVRGILLFARGEPLGEKGLDWLKVHLINLTGLKKREPASERLKFANKMLPEILDSADNPMTGRRWWASSEEPWQTLACCREVAAAVRSPDPRRYVCHLPVHQDGSCNGLQHYAALGRDAHGARQVNLLPEDRPQDVYSGVAAMVERERTKDAANGVAIAQVLEGFIKRKVVKQTVMTVVYGVTRFGAHLQIMKQLKDLEDFPQEHCWAASHYLVQRTFLSLQEMFTATREIQEWLTSSAKLISQVCGQPVEWVTPLGLPVVQPYHKNASVRSPVSFGDRIPQDYWSSFEMYQRPNVMKQKNAFPPNFIHSLDSSHMMLTALFCHKAGIQFVSVHDCFWTHPNTVDIMNKMCREQFVALHSEPILENLSQYLVGKFGYRDSELLRDGSLGELAKQKLNRILTQIPQKGSFELKNVLDSVYFFS